MSEILESYYEIINGVRFSIKLVPDYDSEAPTSGNGDCYSAEDVKLWKGDSWQFIGVIVAVDIEGIAPEWADASLWGTQYGSGDGWTAGRKELLDYPVKDLADEAMDQLAKIGQRLADADIARAAALTSWRNGLASAKTEVMP